MSDVSLGRLARYEGDSVYFVYNQAHELGAQMLDGGHFGGWTAAGVGVELLMPRRLVSMEVDTKSPGNAKTLRIL